MVNIIDSKEADYRLFRPLLHTSNKFYIAIAILLAIYLAGVYAYIVQFRSGLGVTGMNRPTYWGIYITNFVFFIGISHAGTLISAILRICKAEWRRAITRSAEVITVLVLFFGVGSIICDLGRPDRLFNIIFHGEIRSPLLWDVVSISIYLMGSVIYLYLPLIPDCAILRDRLGKRTWFYRILALGWTGTPKQVALLEKLIGIMAILILPIAISVHTVVSWVFAMTIQPMWHSTIFGPYFVVGAIFSGIAALLIAMAIFRKAYGLENYVKELHFKFLGSLMTVMALLWFYFTFAEYLTTFYGGEPTHMAVFWAKLTGSYAPYFWTMVVCCFVIPMTILVNPRTRKIKWIVVASVSVIIGMWLERFTIVVPTLVNPRLPYARGFYYPTWVEIVITAACFAGFILLYMLFTKLFPIVSIWEIRDGHKGVKETTERLETYLPDDLSQEVTT